MYKTSTDRRFLKNKQALRRAFLDLVVERGYQGLTVSDVTRRADLNRMTFYGHYETIEDIFQEFVDDMEAEIALKIAQEPAFDIDNLFSILNTLMFREIDFFRHVANSTVGPDFKTSFKNTIARLVQVRTDDSTQTETERLILSDQIAVCIAYSYLDWLAGDYAEATLDDVIKLTKSLLGSHLCWISYK